MAAVPKNDKFTLIKREMCQITLWLILQPPKKRYELKVFFKRGLRSIKVTKGHQNTITLINLYDISPESITFNTFLEISLLTYPRVTGLSFTDIRQQIRCVVYCVNINVSKLDRIF